MKTLSVAEIMSTKLLEVIDPNTTPEGVETAMSRIQQDEFTDERARRHVFFYSAYLRQLMKLFDDIDLMVDSTHIANLRHLGNYYVCSINKDRTSLMRTPEAAIESVCNLLDS